MPASEVVWPWRDLGLELERPGFQPSSATIDRCDPGQVTAFLQVELGKSRWGSCAPLPSG